MARAALAVVLVGLGLWLGASEGFAQEVRSSKTRVSANGVYGIRMFELGPKSCRVQAVKEDQMAWELDQCVGTADDAYFVSDDGQKFWVLRTLPAVPDGRQLSHGKGLENVAVAALYQRDGGALKAKRLRDFVGPRQMGKVRRLDHHFEWLEGVAGVFGKGPRLNERGEIEFEAVGSKTYRLSF